MPGPLPMQPRDGDKLQARQRINVEVRTGRRPHPNALPCADCGHVWSEGERRHEYDHHLGYDAAHHYDVEAVCTRCHHLRSAKTHCSKGHPFDDFNTIVGPRGRLCRACRREHDRNRGRDAAYWRAYRTRRGAKNG